MQVRRANDGERPIAIDLLAKAWRKPIIVRSQVWSLNHCDIFIAGDFEGLAAVSSQEKPIAELVAINAFVRHQSIGSALLHSIINHLQAFELLRLTTTNDNLDALRFYQRRGFRLHALRPGAVDETRRLHKPMLSTVGEHGIPIHDELDLILQL